MCVILDCCVFLRQFRVIFLVVGCGVRVSFGPEVFDLC